MDIDDNDDDFYAPEPSAAPETAEAAQVAPPTAPEPAPADQKPDADGDLEEGEEEDEGGAMDEDDSSDSDGSMVIITERKDGTSAAPPSQARYSNIKDIPQRSITNNTASKAPPSKPEDVKTSTPAQNAASASGADYPAVRTSTVEINAIPTHKGTGKPITQVNIDEDLPENDKPWRKPGTDLSDYFNYGFDEFTWAMYASKQEQLRGEYNSDAIANNNKKMFEDMQMMMMGGGGMPGMPTMPGMPGGAGAGAAGAGMSGMDAMTPEMQQMMQQMMAGGGMDPSQMDQGSMNAMFAAMQNGGVGGQGQGGQGQNFGGQNFGNQGFGYDQGNNMGGGNRGGFAGRGRRGRGNYNN